MMPTIQHFLNKAANGQSFSIEEAEQAFNLVMGGEATNAQIAGLLMALRVRGETVEEITGAAMTMRSKATAVSAPSGSIDMAGTGGTGKDTFNISTCASFVIAGAGIPVAKHGNRSASSKSGSADVLEALGVKLGSAPENVSRCVAEANIGFMFAQAHHSAMKYVMPARKELAIRTIFNLLGPLTNPAGSQYQVLGVFDKAWLEPLALVLKNLGSKTVWIVHGGDGMDEITTTDSTYVCQLKDGEISTFTVSPEDVGLPRVQDQDLVGGDAQSNAQAIRDVLAGQKNPFRDIVLFNSAAALVVCGKANTLTDAIGLAAASIDEGHAQQALDKLVEISNETES